MSKYKDYLKSEKWKTITSIRKELDGSCVLCGSKDNLIVHHRHYENLYHESINDLVTLCKEHHDEFHNKRTKYLSYERYYQVWGNNKNHPDIVPKVLLREPTKVLKKLPEGFKIHDLYIAMAQLNFTSTQGKCYSGPNTMAKYMPFDDKFIMDSLKKWESAGMLKIEHRFTNGDYDRKYDWSGLKELLRELS